MQCTLELLAKIEGRNGTLELDHQTAVGRPMQENIELDWAFANTAANCDRDQMQILLQLRTNSLG